VRPARPEEVVVVVEEPESRPVAVTFNPVPIVLGRLSGNVEVLLATHHALVLSANALVFNVDRGGRNVVSDGFGFASPTSGSVGVEVGYHYWLRWSQSLRGLFLGPSLLAGLTSNAQVGDPTTTQAYYGLAFDVGRQAVLPGGFTFGGGLGVAFIHMATTTTAYPRALLQAGWSF
jgi:hypothetical protein